MTPPQRSGATLGSEPGATADSEPVQTLVADRTILDSLPFQDKPTTITPGQQERAATAWSATGERARTGYWECGTGTFTAQRDGVHEICYIVSGRASLRDASGTVTEVSAGTILVLPAGWNGTWDVHEPVEKMFVMIQE
jgi:uncharacterized cupin superfamily protein